MVSRSVAHATFVIERTYDASPTRVFQAFADPAAHDRWFVKNDGWEIAEYTHDFRIGGRESGRFSPKRGDSIYYNETVYQDLVPNKRIVFAYTMAREDTRISASLATVELIPKNGKTLLIYTEQGAFLDGFDQPADREAGWRGLLESLDIELRRDATALKAMPTKKRPTMKKKEKIS